MNILNFWEILYFNEILMRIKFTVRPLHVEILFNNQPLSAERQYEIECQAIGSRPPSIITWWMNGVALVALPSKVRIFHIFEQWKFNQIEFADKSRWKCDNIDVIFNSKSTR